MVEDQILLNMMATMWCVTICFFFVIRTSCIYDKRICKYKREDLYQK